MAVTVACDVIVVILAALAAVLKPIPLHTTVFTYSGREMTSAPRFVNLERERVLAIDWLGASEN